MSTPRWLPVAGAALLAAVFTWLNRGERVAVELGLLRFYRAPLTLVVCLAFLAGMLAMLLLSLRHDRRVREELRARGLLEPAPPRPAAPVASAWGVTREPAAPRPDERTVAYPREEERTAAYPRLDEGVTPPDDRPATYPRLENRGGDDERTPGYPRLDEDPAA